MHLRQSVNIYSAWGLFTACIEIMQKFKETWYSRYIYQNKLDRAGFQKDMAYGNFKNLPRRTASSKILRDKTINIAKILKYGGYQRGLASMAYKYFDKKSALSADESASGSGFNKKIIANQHLAEELYKLVIGQFENENLTNLLKIIFGVLI